MDEIIRDTKEYTMTIFGITALQMPTLISISPKHSILFKLQELGFPFNMSKQFMRRHIAFSPGNILSGRYYTLFTSVYYHTDLQHLTQNMVVLTAAGQPVHKKVGRRHFLAIFTGGGFFGNLGMWVYYLMQRSIFTKAAEDLQQLPSSASNIFVKICEDKCSETKLLTIDPNILNYGISCYGSSAGVNAILSFGACCSAERIVRKLQECVANRDFELDFFFFMDLTNIIFTVRLFSNDVVGIIATFLSENGFFDQLKKSENIIGYGGHLAGTWFGLVYYYYMYRKQ